LQRYDSDKLYFFTFVSLCDVHIFNTLSSQAKVFANKPSFIQQLLWQTRLFSIR